MTTTCVDDQVGSRLVPHGDGSPQPQKRPGRVRPLKQGPIPRRPEGWTGERTIIIDGRVQHLPGRVRRIRQPTFYLDVQHRRPVLLEPQLPDPKREDRLRAKAGLLVDLLMGRGPLAQRAAAIADVRAFRQARAEPVPGARLGRLERRHLDAADELQRAWTAAKPALALPQGHRSGHAGCGGDNDTGLEAAREAWEAYCGWMAEVSRQGGEAIARALRNAVILGEPVLPWQLRAGLDILAAHGPVKILLDARR